MSLRAKRSNPTEYSGRLLRRRSAPPSNDGSREIVIGTANPDKLRELRRLLSPLNVRVVSISRFRRVPRVVENGRTFEENACKKARTYSKISGILTLADDSGLCVPVLGGAPGVFSARFAGPGCSYADNNQKLLKLLEGRRGKDRRAAFHCVIALYDKGKKVAAFHGTARGGIAATSRGKKGFGYDPVFIPDGYKKTFAELSPTQKNRISHRGKALRAVKEFLKRHCGERGARRSNDGLCIQFRVNRL